MNYIQLINNFWVSHEIHSFRANDTAIYFYLLKVNNAIGWRGNFERNRYKIMTEFDIKDRRTLQSSLDKLTMAGLIQFKTKTKSAVITFTLLSNSCAKNAQDNAQDNVQGDVQDDAQDDVHLNINQTKPKTPYVSFPKNEGNNKQRKERSSFVAPTEKEIEDYAEETNKHIIASRFVSFYASKGWTVGRAPMKCWKAAVDNWQENTNYQNNGTNGTTSTPQPKYQTMAERLRAEADAARDVIMSEFTSGNSSS